MLFMRGACTLLFVFVIVKMMQDFSRAKKYPGSYGNRGKRACPTIDDRVDSRFNGNLRATSGHSPQEESVKPLDSEFGVTKVVQVTT